MKFLVCMVTAMTINAAILEQDPCAGCDTSLAQAYQTCAMKYGNPCAETNKAGIVSSGPGTKKDIGCCMKKKRNTTGACSVHPWIALTRLATSTRNTTAPTQSWSSLMIKRQWKRQGGESE